MYPSHKVKTLDSHSLDGREFVTIDDFLDSFPKATNIAKENFRDQARMMMNDTVEKRMDESLMQGLLNRCLSSKRRESLYAPTVTASGWVFWTSGFHQKLIESLAALHLGEDYASDYQFFQQKLGWSISSMNCRTILVPSGYRVSREDKKIFELFSINEV